MFIQRFGFSAWLSVLGFAVFLALLLHPLQYTLTQLFEGYWGSSALGRSLVVKCILRHRGRATRLSIAEETSTEKWMSHSHHSRPGPFRRQFLGQRNEALKEQLALERLGSKHMDYLIPTYWAAQAAYKSLTAYPENHGRIMPTRLGNILRRHEDAIGSGLGLDAVTAAPYISQVANQRNVDRVSDEGEQMDLAVRLSMVFITTTLAYAVVLAPYGIWVIATLAPYACAYLAYIGACAAAESYMSAVSVMVHLDRFALYEALHLGRPASAAEEKELTQTVMDLVNNVPLDDTRPYVHLGDAGYLGL